MSKMPKLELYYKDTCPYCVKVLNALEDIGKTVTLKSIKDNPNNLEHLVSVAGKKQVPCLFIDGAPMHESDEIVLWLIEHAEFLEDMPSTKRL